MNYLHKVILYALLLIGFPLSTLAQRKAIGGVYGGIVKVKLDAQTAELLNRNTFNSRSSQVFGISPLDAVLSTAGVSRIERLIPYAAKHEAKLAKSGMNRWYVIYFEKDVAPASLAAKLSAVGTVEKTSLELESKPYAVESQVNVTYQAVKSMMNDPRLRDQWHYDNMGLNGGRVGADVKLARAHQIEIGKPNVIVSIHDFGVDYSHLDLGQNMWVNQAELNGIPGIDDDANGYVDDVYGYNFAASSAKINPGEHGTHVAGTVAAVNNNGIGVVGVAGGNGLPESGIRLMSAQTFDSGSSAAGRHALSLIYAANNGSVISQNSWGYTTPGGYEAETLEAIDYFIDFAGDYPGSPMKGGLVIFASGNSSMGGMFYPGCYKRVISVSSTNNKDEASYYTNYDGWVSLSAPGGETSTSSDPRGILSTVPNNRYDYLQGTSMACPHVSGVAALIVSKFGHEKYTPEEVKHRLIQSSDTLEYLLPKYRGKMGAGRLNAWIALSDPQGKSPLKPQLNVVSVAQDAVSLSWNVVADAGGAYVNTYHLFYSEQPVSTENLSSARCVQIRTSRMLDQKTSYELKGLKSNGTYHFIFKAIDLFGNVSYSDPLVAATEAGPALTVSHGEFNFNLTYPNLQQQQAIHIANEGVGELRWESTVQKFIETPLKSLLLKKSSPLSIDSDAVMDVTEVRPYAVSSTICEEVVFTDSIWYDPNRRGDKRIGINTSGAIYTVGKRFTVNHDRGFILSHVKYTFSRDGSNLPLIFEVYKDGVYPNSGELVSEFMYYGGEVMPADHLVELPSPVKFDKGEYFWVVVYHPQGMRTPSLINEPEYLADYDFVSSDAGNNWSEISVAYGKPAMFKIRALQGTSMSHISLSPDFGKVAPGMSENVNVFLDASRLINGLHKANVYIMSNDATNGRYAIPVILNVAGQLPQPVMDQNILEFAGVSVGGMMSKDLTVTNKGYGVWNVSEIRLSNSDYRVNAEGFSLQPGEQKTVRIDFIPTQEDANSTGAIRFISKEVNAEARLIGYGRSASRLVTEALSVDVAIAQGEPVKKVITLRNEGKNALIYSIPKLSSGGAEITTAGNFSWENHVQEHARPYRFEDISESGVPVPFVNAKDDASALNVPVGFSFPYFEKAFEAVNINYNGFINFSSMPSTTHINRAIPSKDAPKNAIFGMWADIIGTTSIRYKSTPDCFIVQWTDARFYKSTLTATFQIALFPSGIVEIRYRDMDPASGQDIYTIGLQNETGLTGVGVTHKAAYATAQSMTTFYPYTCNAVSAVDKREGIINPAESETIELTLDASIDKLTDGKHMSDLLIVTNDPVNAAFHLPITLNVMGEGNMNVAVRNIDFENTLTTVAYEYGLLIRNNGNKAIRVVPQTDNQVIKFGEFAEGISIDPYGHASLPVYFTPVATGNFTGVITLVSDQKDGATATIDVVARVTESPKMSLSRTSLDVRVEAGKEFESNLTVSNLAQTSVLDYTISAPEWLQVIDPSISGAGEDSDYGYRWRDNKGANASVVGYSWTDIRTSAQELEMDMTAFYAAFDLPFSFPFYGKEQNRIYVSGFGAIAFTAEDAAGLNIQSIPVKDKSNGLILPLYNAMLQPSLAQSRYYAKAEADRVILQFQNIQTKVGGSVTFQVHLFADGRINCYYSQVENFMYIAQALVGLEDYDGKRATVVTDKRNYLQDRMALEFYPPKDDSLQPGSNKTWSLKVSALDKYEMSAADKILIRSNDPKVPLTEIPVSLQVIGKVEMVYPAVVDMGYVFVVRDNQNQPVAQPFEVTIANRGSKKARVTAIELKNIHANLVSQVVTQTPLVINEQDEIAIEFMLAAKGVANMVGGQLVISFEDGTNATILLNSKTTLPPVASVSTDYITWKGMSDDAHTPVTITLSNTGSSANGVLKYNVSTRYLSGPHITNQTGSVFLNRTKTAEQKLTTNEVALSQTVPYQVSDLIFQDSLFYDQAGIPDDYVGFGTGDFMCANKFTVADKAFRLTHAYNYYYTSYALSGTVAIVKGGSNPDHGTLLVEVPFTQEGSGEIYVALPEAILFEPGETFWVVFSVKNAPNAQGVNINSRMSDVSYYTNGEAWYELIKDSGLNTRPVFKIRAYSIAEEWLDVMPIEGSVAMAQSQEIVVAMKPLSLPKPKSYAELVIKTNDPLRREILIPVSVLLNERPQFVETPAQVDRITEGETRHYKFMATDLDGDAVTYGVKETLPPPFSLNVTDGAAYLTLNAEYGTAGIYTVTVTATDGINSPVEFTMVVEVIKINRPPVTTIDDILPIRLASEPMVIDLNHYFSDPDGDDLLYGHQVDSGQQFEIERVMSRLTLMPSQIGEGVFTIFCSDGKRSVSKKLPVIVESVNSMNEVRKQSMLVYPNPATTFTQISWDAEVAVDRLELLTVDGKLMKTVSVSGLNRYQLDLTQVASGYYMIRLLQKEDVIVNKQLIKQ